MFAVAGVLAFAAAIALWQGVDAFRWQDRRRLRIASALILPLGIGAGAAIWAGNRYPAFNFWGNLGRGPDWVCENLGRAGAVACARGSAPPLSEKPSGK